MINSACLKTTVFPSQFGRIEQLDPPTFFENRAQGVQGKIQG